MRPLQRCGLGIGSLSLAGMLFGHLAVAKLAAPAAHHGGPELGSGHGLFVIVATAFLLSALVATFSTGAARRRARWAPTALGLTIAQSLGCLTLETIEHFVFKTHGFQPRLFLLAILVQTLVAFIGATLIVAIARLAVVARRRVPGFGTYLTAVWLEPQQPFFRSVFRPRSSRAPPVTV